MSTPSRVALVTGASSGIGRATALVLGAAGFRVALCARRWDRLQQVAREIEAAGGAASPHPVDVTDLPAVTAVVSDVEARWEAVDVLVNSAGRGLAAGFEDTAPDELRALLELNVVAAAHAARAVLPGMRRRQRGHIVNVASIVGRRGLPGRSAYAATKFALIGWSEALRLELRGTGIAVTVVNPVRTATEFHAVEPTRRAIAAGGPLQSAEHVARTILRCLRRPRAEVYPFRPARALAALSVIAPALADRVLARFLRQSAPPGCARR